ncbi:MAG: damage-inducible mutagenesis protein [Acetobacteraceae bacterium]|nr:damage-inducible mutagenesis protein [Acetobacteraceae bacterium]
MPTATVLQELRRQIARIERATPARADSGEARTVALRVAVIDRALPGGGLALGALHEVAGAGPEVEHGAAAALFAAGLLARLRGPVLWALAQPDLFAPALAAVGLSPRRVVYVEAGAAVLLAMEEGLRQKGLAGVVGEVGRLGLTPSRRLQLAAEASGALALALRRSRRFDDPALDEPSAAVTRWRVASLPSPPPLPEAPDTPGLARARWRLDLVRARGGEPGSWIVEACDAKGRLALVAGLADRPASAERHAAR